MDLNYTTGNFQKIIKINLTMNLSDALAFYELIDVAKSSLEQQIETLLNAYPQWKDNYGKREHIDKFLDKAGIQHTIICQMEAAFRNKLEKEKLLKKGEKIQQTKILIEKAD